MRKTICYQLYSVRKKITMIREYTENISKFFCMVWMERLICT
jgi:hypothetical protein